MGAWKSFEEIQAWQQARALAKEIYLVSCENSFSKDFGLKNQINRSSGSVMDNIAEGFERNGSREFIQFLAIAKGSAGEVRSQLYRAYDRDHINEQKFTELADQIMQVSKLISGLMSYLIASDRKGFKFNTPSTKT